MRNLWLFISKYNAFFLFCFFFLISLLLLLNNNSYQEAWTFNVAKEVSGNVYEKINSFSKYLDLAEINDRLALENAQLKNKLRSSYLLDSVERRSVHDSLHRQQYTYTVARVVNNSINQANNYLIINRGRKHGIEKGMGVTGPDGIVGLVRDVSDNFARVQSLLHTESRFSGAVNGSIGSLIWGEGNRNSKLAFLKDIPTHISIKPGDLVVTSGYSLFPKDIKIGTVKKVKIEKSSNFLDIELILSTDFSSLQYVYVVDNRLIKEQQELEAQDQKL